MSEPGRVTFWVVATSTATGAETWIDHATTADFAHVILRRWRRRVKGFKWRIEPADPDKVTWEKRRTTLA